MEIKTILFTKENWLNSQLSIARFYGGLKLGNHDYIIMRDSGDLLRMDFAKYYTKLGRKKLHEILRANNHVQDKELKEICEKALKETKNPQVKQQDLFTSETHKSTLNRPVRYCRTCKHRERWALNDFSTKVVQCCNLQPSKHSNSGYKTIKVTNIACKNYEEGE